MLKFDLMRYGIVGSRRLKDPFPVWDFIETLKPDDVVISGGATGPDSWAADAARVRGHKVIEYLPDLSNKRTRHEIIEAYYSRNAEIAADCDVLVAFVAPDRKGGTENTIKHAARLGKPVTIILPPALPTTKR